MSIDNPIRLQDNCPYCNTKLDATVSYDGSETYPEIGDISICIGCYQASEFDNNLKLIKIDINKCTANEQDIIIRSQLILRQSKKYCKGLH